MYGKELFYNNIWDVDVVFKIVSEFIELVVVVVKYMNLCGVGVGENIEEVYLKVYEVDEMFIFGGIVVLNKEVDVKIVEYMSKIFLEIIIVLSFFEEVFVILVKKKNICLLIVLFVGFVKGFEKIFVNGGFFI